MNASEVEQALRDLATRGQCLKRSATRQVWRLVAGNKALIIKFYPDRENRWRKRLRGSLAMYEFTRLQWLQKAKVPSPRAVAALMGFVVNGVKGDAVVMEAIEPAERLDLLINRHEVAGEPLPRHRSIAGQVVEIVHALGEAGLGHSDLHLGNFLVSASGTVHLIDAYPLHRRGLTQRDLFKLGLSVRGIASRGDIIRAWRRLAPGTGLPVKNPLLAKHWRKLQSRIWGENAYFGRLQGQEWSGVFFRHAKYGRRGLASSTLEIGEEDWRQQWPELLQKIESGGCEVLKSSRSGDVLATLLTLAGRELQVIVKRPRRKKLVRYLSEIGRGSRARRAWKKSWSLLHRELPTAWPLLMMERRQLGYVTDAIIVYERIAGVPLSQAPLDTFDAGQRLSLFHRTGRLLRLLEETHLYHWDAKSSNWMVRPDDKLGPCPVMVDVDGIRWNWGIAEGMRRLLLAMREHPQYTPEDSLHLCRGYAPFSPIPREDGES